MTYSQALAKNYDEVRDALYKMRIEAYKNTHTEQHVEEFDAYKQCHMAEDVRLALALARRITDEDMAEKIAAFEEYAEDDGPLVVDATEDAEDAYVYSGKGDGWAVGLFCLVAVVTCFIERGTF